MPIIRTPDHRHMNPHSHFTFHPYDKDSFFEQMTMKQVYRSGPHLTSPNMYELIHIVYVSFALRNLSEKELHDLLEEIRAKNHSRDVTGLLLYNDRSFIQVIEGGKKTIQHLFNTIKNDSRHTNVVKLLEEPIDKRAFPDWSMGFQRISNEQSSKIPGFSDFMQREKPAETIRGSTQQVVYLLDSFRKYT